MDYLCFEEKLAFHAAPTLLGIKAANMLSINKSEFNAKANVRRFNEMTEKKGLRIDILCECGKKLLILVYNKKLLEKRLSDPSIRDFLSNYGYSLDFSLEECIARLSERIRLNDDFPHEVGIFLDYPLEDVVGFIENNGTNYKLCGTHKVYGDEIKAARTFENYNKCRKFLCNKLNMGNDFYQVLKIS